MSPYGQGPAGDGRRADSGRSGGDRGIPDGLLVGVLGLLLGLAALIWTATGLAAWLHHGRWPDGLGFHRTPMAMRRLVTEPQDIAAAWPDVPAEQLSGYGLFWGVFIGQLMVLTVLAVFVLGTVTRWRAVRASRRTGAGLPAAGPVPEPSVADHAGETAAGGESAERTAPVALDKPEPGATDVGVAKAGVTEVGAAKAGVTEASAAEAGGRGGSSEPEPPTRPGPVVPAPAVNAAVATTTTAPAPGLIVAPHDGAAADAVREAPGAVVVVTADVDVWSDTVGARAKLGPAHVYDPEQRTDAPTRLRWAPHHGCHDMDTARSRSAALLAPVRSPARSDAAVHAAAETLLRCWLHAAAVAGEPFRQVHRWALTGSSKDAVRILRTDTSASAGAAGELEATLTAYPERREAAVALVRRALDCVSRLHIRNACIAARSDRIAMESFVPEGGSLYLVGESLEAPHRGNPGVMPLLTALTSAVVEHGRRMAARSSAGRLDPPVTLVLDQPATVAPLPELPSLLAEGEADGLVTHALVRSRAQLQTWWPGLERRADARH